MSGEALVLDLGSGLTKGGYGGRAEPVCVLGSVVGVPKQPRILPTTNEPYVGAPDGTQLGLGAVELPDGGRERYQSRAAATSGAHCTEYVIGDALRELRGVVALMSPMRRGAVRNWDAAEALWRHTITTGLSTNADDHPTLITENPSVARPNREKLAEIFFDSFRVPALYIATPAVLALYAAGRTGGLVLDVGADTATALAVSAGHLATTKNSHHAELGGVDVDERLGLLLRKSGSALGTSASEQRAVRRAKERFCYVAERPGEEEAAIRKTDANVACYELPDGNTLYLGPERFRAPEILFRPALAGMESPGVAELVHGAVEDADIELRKGLYSNVLLTGGTTKMRGFAKRLLGEVRNFAPKGARVRVLAPKDRLTTAFTGGTILASLTTFKEMTVTKEEWYDHGKAIVHRKTFG